MHERCTYVCGDEQRASVLPVIKMNCHSCVLNLHRCMLISTLLWRFSNQHASMEVQHASMEAYRLYSIITQANKLISVLFALN